MKIPDLRYGSWIWLSHDASYVALRHTMENAYPSNEYGSCGSVPMDIASNAADPEMCRSASDASGASRWRLKNVLPEELKKRFPFASASFLALNCSRVCSPEPEQDKGKPLVSPVPRKEKSRIVSASRSEIRLKITYRIFAQRPLDWDNYHIKCLQDLLVQSGIIPGDEWNI